MATAELQFGPRLTDSQYHEICEEAIPNARPVRFLVDGCALNILTGYMQRRGTNVVHQMVYWNFSQETADKIAQWLGAKVVWC